MRFLTADDITMTIVQDGASLLVSWRIPDRYTFESVKRTFTAAFPARWNPDQRAWELPISERYNLRQWLRMHVAGDAVEWVEDSGPRSRSRAYTRPQSTPPDPLGDAYRRLCLTTDAPAGLAEVAYRWWVRQVHPDAGGSHEAAVAINAAMDTIRAARLEAAS